MNPVVILLSLAVTLFGIECFPPMEVGKAVFGYTIVKHFRWPADANRIQNMSDAKDIRFSDSEIEIIPQNFTDQFKHCTEMWFFSGRVRTVIMNSQLQKISLDSTDTESVVINRGQSYALEDLFIENSKLTRIPKNLYELEELRYLNIAYSPITFILMDELNGLKKLEHINFHGNHITQIESYGKISLPSLSQFYLFSNLLQHVDACSWYMPSLEALYLNSNKLTHLAISHFPNLKELTLYKNPLNCAWTERLLNFSERYRLVHGINACDKQSEGDFRLECPVKNIDFENRFRYKLITQWRINSDLHDKLSDVNAKLNKTINLNKKLIEKINAQRHLIADRMSIYENRLSELTKQLNETTGKNAGAISALKEQSTQQYNTANDIIEAMYRIDIQRSMHEDDILDLSRNFTSLAEKLDTAVNG